MEHFCNGKNSEVMECSMFGLINATTAVERLRLC